MNRGLSTLMEMAPKCVALLNPGLGRWAWLHRPHGDGDGGAR